MLTNRAKGAYNTKLYSLEFNLRILVHKLEFELSQQEVELEWQEVEFTKLKLNR